VLDHNHAAEAAHAERAEELEIVELQRGGHPVGARGRRARGGPELGTDGQCSPSHEMPFDFRNEADG
jgi:hypothetical protein